MRGILIFLAIVGYLFALVYIESELVKIEIRKEYLKNQLETLKNQKRDLEFELVEFTNLARIEAEAKSRGFIFPQKEDILGVIK
jgi:chaperonin cofactor prefoldin